MSVTALAGDELEVAIAEPARRSGADFEPGLVSRIVADVADQPGALPLLQYALTELYDRRVSGMLRIADYEDLGGVSGAVARQADELYEALPTDERAGVRLLFGRLVSPGDGPDGTRRRALRTELASIPAEVVSAYGDARLISFDHEPATREPTVEVAHEALIREWPRLQRWLDEDREGLRIVQHLTGAAEAWAAAGRDDGELYRGSRLESAIHWADSHAGELSPAEQEFLDASHAAHEALQRRERRRVRRLRVGLAVTGVVAVVALVAGVVAVQQRRRADDTAFDADVRRMAADAADLADEDPALALLVAATAHQQSERPETLGALQRTLSRTDGLLGYLGGDSSYRSVAFTGDGRLVARSDLGLEVWDVATRTQLAIVDLDGAGELAVLVGAEQAATSAPDGALHLVDLGSGRVEASTPPGTEITALAASSDGGRLAIGRTDGTITLVDLHDLAAPVVIRDDVDATALVFGDDESLVVATAFGLVLSIDLADGRERWQSTREERFAATGVDQELFSSEANNPVLKIQFEPEEGVILVPSAGMTTALDAGTGLVESAWPSEAELLAVDSVFVGDERLLRGTELMDTSTGEVVRVLRAAEGQTLAAAVTPEEDMAAIATADGDRTVVARRQPDSGSSRPLRWRHHGVPRSRGRAGGSQRLPARRVRPVGARPGATARRGPGPRPLVGGVDPPRWPHDLRSERRYPHAGPRHLRAVRSRPATPELAGHRRQSRRCLDGPRGRRRRPRQPQGLRHGHRGLDRRGRRVREALGRRGRARGDPIRHAGRRIAHRSIGGGAVPRWPGRTVRHGRLDYDRPHRAPDRRPDRQRGVQPRREGPWPCRRSEARSTCSTQRT